MSHKAILSQAKKNLLAIENIEEKKKVFLIGMSKTATTSMETLLEQLGYRVCKGHWNYQDTNFLCACYCHNDINEILNITKYYDAFGDAPWGGTLLYEELVKLYPDAYYILTTRDTEKWYKSYIGMYQQYDENLETAMETMRSFGAYGNYIFFRKIFGIENLVGNEIKIKKYYDSYNRKVKNFFKDKNYNFMEIDITDADADTNSILKFIGKSDAENIVIPHMNKGNY